MPEDAGISAVAEPIESAGASESVETVVESPETDGEVTKISNEGDSPSEKQALTPATPGKNRQVLESIVKKSADALKAISPELPAAMRQAVYELGRLYNEFPQGLKEAVQQKQILSEYGGVEGLKETQEALSDYGALESKFEKGDPAFLADLADALPSAFSQIMPGGLSKWKAVDPESYNHHQAQVFTQTLDQFKVSATLAQIWQRLDPEKQQAERQAISDIWDNLEGLRKAAEKAPERKTNPQDEALTKREQDLVAREQRALIQPIANDGRRQLQTITDREMNASYKWNETDASVKDAVSERVRQEVVKSSQKDQTFTREFDRLKDRGDSAGLARHVKNFQDRVTPGIVQRVAKLFAVKPKGAGSMTVKKPAVAVNGNGHKQEPNWERISQQPSARDIDYAAMGRNAEDMLMSQKAILKSGKRVNW